MRAPSTDEGAIPLNRPLRTYTIFRLARYPVLQTYLP